MRKIRGFLKKIKNILRDVWWHINGTNFRNPPFLPTTSSIIFVCKGNICRSTFAHYLITQNINKKGRYKNLKVDSAGLRARTGTASPSTAIQVAQEFSVDMEMHRSKLLTQSMADTADMLIAMEPNQVRRLQHLYPHRRQHIYLMAEFDQKWRNNYYGWSKYHIQDPYGKDHDQFRTCFQRLKRSVEGLLERCAPS